MTDISMKNKIIFSLIILFIIHHQMYGQQKPVLPVPSNLYQIKLGTEKIKINIDKQLNKNTNLVEYPMQDYYHMLYLTNNLPKTEIKSDTTPPSDPSNLIVNKFSVFSVYVEFTPSIDSESGIYEYVFGIGSAPNTTDIRWWQALGTNTSTIPKSLFNLGIPEGSIFYITIYSINGAGMQSNHISTPPIQMNWESLGNSTNSLIVQYANWGYDTNGTTIIAGWDSVQINKYVHFISRMLPIIKEIYGPPSHSNTITLVRNLYYSGSNVFFPGTNQIHKDDNFNPQLLTHELIHAFRDDVVLSMDSNWNYNSKLSGFEEGFAQGASYICMNRYVQLYPNDTLVNYSSPFGSSMDWDYDFRNVSNITTEDFWSDYGGMALSWERYEMGAAAMRKLHLVDSNMFKNFNTAYYSYLNNNNDSTPSRKLISNLLSSVITQVEGIPTNDWINKQKIFDCKIKQGRKVWVRTQHYPWTEYLIFQWVNYYETFSNGNDWAHYDTASSSWIYYDLNGSVGLGTVTNYADSIIWQRNLLISQYTGGIGWDRVNFSTDNDLSPWPGGDTADFVLNMNQFGLYKLHINFDTTSISVYRVIGDELKNTTGIFGGILNAKGGKVFIDHDGYSNEPPLDIVNGAFWGTRQWASVPNSQTGGKDSKPGKVTFRYIDSLGNVYQTYRNIDWGSYYGNQLFLLNVNEMQFLAGMDELIISNNIIIIPNPCNGVFRIKPSDLKCNKIIIYNSIGEIIYHSEFKDTEINLSTKPKGIYFIEISTEEKTYIKKLVIQ